VEKGYTQGTILSLLNSFELDAADNAHDSEYDPFTMIVTSMFAGDDKNQWLDQVEKEFGSDLSDHDDNNVQNSGTTIELDKDAKALMAKEMKGKDHDLEGIESRSRKRTHHTNMTGKTGMTSNCSVTTKSMPSTSFSRRKTSMRSERRLQLWNSGSEKWSLPYLQESLQFFHILPILFPPPANLSVSLTTSRSLIKPYLKILTHC
jgi:hypothetical protein